MASVSVIVHDVLTCTFDATVTAPCEAEICGEFPCGKVALGSVQLTGITFSHLDVAKWLTRLAGVDAFTNAYLSLSSKATIGPQPVVNFNSSVQLSDQALRRNQPGAERQP